MLHGAGFFLEGYFLYKGVKRALDVTFSLIGTAVSSPILLAVAAAVKLDSKGPAMCVGAEHMGTGQYSYKGDSRVTRVGKIIRATSLDELPQFINILKGDMSFIGPRPTLTYHPWKLEEYTDFQRRRFEVRPGITGLAQVHGRKAIDWNDRIKYDVEYVDNLSLGLDCKILFQTVWNVLTMKDNDNVGKTSQTKENKDA